MKSLRIVVMALCMIVGVVSFAQGKSTQAAKAANGNVVEVMYFHGKQRCVTCMAIEKLTKEVVEKDFAKEVKQGKVRYREIDISTDEGEKIADRYEVTWSSLFVNQWKGKKETRNNMTKFGFANARKDPDAFKAGLRDKINVLLNK